MIRTQISLTKEEYQRARKEARALGLSLAELFRRALRQALPVDNSHPWMSYRGLVESGDQSSSANIDSVVYGHKE